ncbi:hypothetical protein BGX20_010357 [Mortierella sp. AD010]|nr:hypothetical protein BGX20_010357 [Mortierella sp. AD010]
MSEVRIDAPTKEQETHFKKACESIILTPFQDKYEDNWEESSYWAAVEKFKAQATKIGIKDHEAFLKRSYGMDFQGIRRFLISGPPLFMRKGWKSPLTGAKVDAHQILARLVHVHGPKFSGKERVVALDFWATCPCVEDAPKISGLAEKYAGRVAIVGINNEGIFSKKSLDVEKIKTFLDERKTDFKYTIYVDNEEGHAKTNLFSKVGFAAVPCVVVLADGVVTYAGGAGDNLEAELQNALAHDGQRRVDSEDSRCDSIKK